MATFFARAAWRSRMSAGLCICVGGALLLPGMQAAKAVWETGRSAADVLHEPKWPPAFPLDAKDMSRLDETSDALFYSQPRFVQHIDEYAVKTLNRHYREVRAHCERQRLRNPERARCFTFHLQVLPKGGAVLIVNGSACVILNVRAALHSTYRCCPRAEQSSTLCRHGRPTSRLAQAPRRVMVGLLASRRSA